MDKKIFQYCKSIIIIFIILMSVPFSAGFQSATSVSNPSLNNFYETSDELYFENVNILLIARCRTVLCEHLWFDKLFFIGEQAHFSIGVHHFLQRVHIIIYNESVSNPYFTLFQLKDVIIFMRNVSGFFFINSWMKFSVRLFPFVIFLNCHTDKLWIRDMG